MKRLFMAGAAICAMLAPAHSAEFNPVPGFPQAIMMTGSIELADGAKLQKVVDFRKLHHLQTGIIVLSSSGGYVQGALDLAGIIEREHMSVAVVAGDSCNSACVILFAAASNRLVSATASIGVHEASDQANSSDSPIALAATEAMTAAFIHYRVPFAVTRLMTSTPGTQAGWVTANDILNWPNTTIISESK